MKKNYFKLKMILGLAFFASAGAYAQTYSYTGSSDTWVVPGGVTSISIEAKGSKGLDGASSVGGNGATMYGEFSVTPGDVLTYYVGGNSAGIKAGGDGSWVENTTTGTLLIVAGGGGGATHSRDGAGAPTTNDGTASISHDGYTDGAPGTGGNGGGAGTGAWGTGGGGGWLSAGGAGAGSPGGAMPCMASYGTTYAAGAGGGYSGGGGVDMASGWGTGGGGAGGSYNVGTAQANVAADNNATGEITFTELCNALTVTISSSEICLGDAFTLDATALSGAAITWDGGVVNGEAFTPAAAGTVTYTATSADASDCGFSVDITVLELPVVTAGVDVAEICVGETVIFSEGGADTYTWDPADVMAGSPYTPGAGTTTFTVTGTDDATGCSNEASVDVLVHELPTVTANADDAEICLGESVTLSGEGASTYEWSDGVTNDEAFTPDATGTTTYELTGTDDNGCVNYDEIEVTVYDAIEITYSTEDELYGDDGSIDITVTGGNPAYSFDWDNDGTGDFDDSEDLTDVAGGTYVVVVEDEAGCTATETIVVESQLSISGNDAIKLAIFPNPTQGAITVQFAGTFNYELTAINGDIVLNGLAVDQAELDLSGFANGIYFVTIKANDTAQTLKVVKK